MIGTYRSQKPEMVRPRHFSHNLVNPFFQFSGQISTPKIRNAKKCCRFFTFLTSFHHFSSIIKIAQRGIFSNNLEKTLKIVKTSQTWISAWSSFFPYFLCCSRFFYAYKLFLYSLHFSILPLFRIYAVGRSSRSPF